MGRSVQVSSRWCHHAFHHVSQKFCLFRLHLSLNCEDCWGTTDDFATSFLHFSLFFIALWDLPSSRPVHSLMLSSHLFLCPPCLLPPSTVPCKMVFAGRGEWETGPYHFSLHRSVHDSQEVFAWSDCMLNLGTNLAVKFPQGRL